MGITDTKLPETKNVSKMKEKKINKIIVDFKMRWTADYKIMILIIKNQQRNVRRKVCNHNVEKQNHQTKRFKVF